MFGRIDRKQKVFGSMFKIQLVSFSVTQMIFEEYLLQRNIHIDHFQGILQDFVLFAYSILVVADIYHAVLMCTTHSCSVSLSSVFYRD